MLITITCPQSRTDVDSFLWYLCYVTARYVIILTSSRQSRNYLVVQISDLHTRVTTTGRVLLLDLASDLLLSLTLWLGTVYHRSWDVLLWTLPLGVIWRRSCSLELMAFLLTFSSGVLCHVLKGTVRPFGRHLGWRRCTASQLIYSCYFF